MKLFIKKEFFSVLFSRAIVFHCDLVTSRYFISTSEIVGERFEVEWHFDATP